MLALTRQSASRLFLLMLVCGCVVSTAAPTGPGESLRTELARLQEQTGLSLATVVYRGVQVVVFAHRTLVKARELPGGRGMVSPDGAEVAFNTGLERSPGRVPHIGISRTDGKDLREYENIEMDGNKCCWSHDKSRLVLTVLKATSSSPGLLTLNLNSGVTQTIADHGSVTTQCWSPDDKQFVYEMDANVQIHDVGDNRSRPLTSGKEPTWSPDGSRIAFLDDDTYYVIHPTGEDKRVLFKKWHPASGLWWSPDSQFVAYVSQAGLLEGGLSALDVETYWLRVRRLKDNSESRVAGAGSESYQWVANSELFREAASHYGHARKAHPSAAR
jgi:Tol biopolymer transport system component